MDNTIIIGVVFAIYMLPMIVAMIRGHKNEMPIAILNLAFGWTVIGWVGCLAWACSHQEKANQGGTNA